jgi:AcrR family transcriptional regulator
VVNGCYDAPVSEPAYTRLTNDARREKLLETATELFAQASYDEISMAQIARHAGISKALLYHYFPSKRDFFSAAIANAAQELRERTAYDPDAPPAVALAASLDAFLAWIEENPEAYANLMRSATAPEIRDLIEGVRSETVGRVLEGLFHDEPAPAKVRTAVTAWLWFMDGACLDWVAHHDLERAEIHGLLLGTLMGALMAAGFSFPAA